MRALLSGLLLISVAACATIERAALPSPELLGASYAEATPVARQQWITALGTRSLASIFARTRRA